MQASTLKEAVNALAIKAKEARTPLEAMQFAQAALNLAQAALTLGEVR